MNPTLNNLALRTGHSARSLNKHIAALARLQLINLSGVQAQTELRVLDEVC